MKKKQLAALLIGIFSLSSQAAQAVELNWSGQFWTEFHVIKNYTMDGSDAGFDTAIRGAGGTTSGYYVPQGGSSTASFETLLLRVRPSIVVNDNIYIKSEWWAGDPLFGFFGSAVPYSIDQRRYDSTFSRGSTIQAQRYWVELLSDFGTVRVGRAPLHWGLGVVWNSGEELWSRYMSTGDQIGIVSKFGAFSVIPTFVLYSAGNNLGGSCNLSAAGVCTPGTGNGGVVDYSFALKYENLEDDFEGGLNFIKRLASANQDSGFNVGPTSVAVGANYNTWDLYARKKMGRFSLAGELPIVTGDIGGLDYSAYGLATEISWAATDSFDLQLRAGHAPGQHNVGTAALDNYRAFYFHPNYHLGMIMFNYQLANFAGYPGTNTTNSTQTPTAAAGADARPEANLRSAWDNPITNANYLSVNGILKTSKWSFNAGLIYAQARETAQAGSFFFNSWKRQVEGTAAIKDQSSNLGLELDLGAAFQWDDAMMFRFDTGFYFPGSFYAFSNTATDNATDTVWATSAKVGISF